MVTFPSWRYGPKGQAAVFQSEDDVPAGWEDHPSKLPAEKPLDEINELRAIYKDRFGKRPFNGWDAETLASKIAEARGA